MSFTQTFVFPLPGESTELPGASDTLTFGTTDPLPSTTDDTSATVSFPSDTTSLPADPTPSPSSVSTPSLPSLSSPALSTSQTSSAPSSTSSYVTPVGAASSNSSVSGGTIAGAVIASLAGVLVLVFALLYVRRRRRGASGSSSHILPTRGNYTEPKPRAVPNTGSLSSRRGHVAQNSSLGALGPAARSTNTLHTLDGGVYTAEKDVSVDGHNSNLPYRARRSSSSVVPQPPRRALGSADTQDTLASVDPEFVPTAAGGAPHRTVSASSGTSTIITDTRPRGRSFSSNPPSQRASANARTSTGPPSPTYPPTASGYPGGVLQPPPRPPRSASRTGSQDSLAERAAGQRQPAATPSSASNQPGPVVAAAGGSLARAPSAGARNKPRKKPVPRYDVEGGGAPPATLGMGVGLPGSLTSVGSGPASPPGLRGAWAEFEGGSGGGKGVHYLMPDMPMQGGR